MTMTFFLLVVLAAVSFISLFFYYHAQKYSQPQKNLSASEIYPEKPHNNAQSRSLSNSHVVSEAYSFDAWLKDPSVSCTPSTGSISSGGSRAEFASLVSSEDVKTATLLSKFRNILLKFPFLGFFINNASSESILKAHDFENWLKVPGVPAKESSLFDASASDLLVEEACSACGILILFGSEYGASQAVAERFTHLARAQCSTPVVCRDMASFEHYSQQSHFNETLMGLNQCEVCFIFVSTHGDGDPPYSAMPFVEFLKSLPQASFTFSYSILAFGDRSYPNFCQCGKECDALLSKCGGNVCIPRHDVDRENDKVIETWIQTALHFLHAFTFKTPLLPSLPPIQMDSNEALHCLNKSKNQRYFPFKGTVVKNILLGHPLVQQRHGYDSSSRLQEEKVTVHLDIDTGTHIIDYSPGDVIGIWPANNEAEVSKILILLGCNGDESIEISETTRRRLPHTFFKATAQQEMFSSIISERGLPEKGVKEKATASSTVALKFALTYLFDIRNLKEEMVTQLGVSTYTHEPQASLTDSLHLRDALQLSHRRIPLQDLINLLKPQLYRLFSLSSSPLHSPPNRLYITVALVRYSLRDSPRTGVASGNLCNDMREGNSLLLFHQPNESFRLPEDIRSPMLMIGPGTGLAPFMAFIYHRRQQLKESELFFSEVDYKLFFGCRRYNEDFIYKEQLKKWSEEGLISLYVAFSREKNGGYIYVCGDAKAMARDVSAALLRIVQTHGKMNVDASTQFLKELKTAKRYQVDVW
ncbi:putative Sulfite reductase [naDPH] flavoprotein component [Cardiosporidium cionae]|uniref:Sulfite reductase [naDPH] flavoprotein component n=1 Tax=Cardiosporidium cionae TaxID=476202 RepID=A0ABQ7JGH8_9APIC|nr:putative Sulfite reductase [naDPH] flavoprotein component [Cardiosporidium cionae]|eukprot:KAF8822974.1 putative Sulfite reductase [naDPH] flavoprotein component [Cardiosporidium cionae]